MGRIQNQHDEGEAEFKFSLLDIRLFGIGLGDNDAGGEELSINGRPSIPLQTLPHHVSGEKIKRISLIALNGMPFLAAAPAEDAAAVKLRAMGLSVTYGHGLGDSWWRNYDALRLQGKEFLADRVIWCEMPLPSETDPSKFPVVNDATLSRQG